jgi:predicted amidohydrolase
MCLEAEMMPMRFTRMMVLLVATTPPILQAGEPPAATPGTLRVAAVQLRSTRGIDANVDRIVAHLQQLAESGVQVAVFPECAVTGYFEDEATGATAEQLRSAELRIAQACRDAGITAIVGTPHRDGESLYNSAVVIDPSGSVVERYHKVQLAEPWPTPGDHLSVFPVEGVPCSIIICHDERYPELVRLPVLAGARVVFYLSHESGIRQERKIGPYRAQIQARAVENSVYVVHANAPADDDLGGSHGQSRIIDPDGTILEEASMFEEETVRAELDLSRASAANAMRSLTRGPLTHWWREGISRVRLIEAPAGASARHD